ncbi:concanavalin A-like lectin/glucanase domain-containing protein [Xylariaceae sp. FL0594]|nr:concanavalin A-like lectin/glucanase domain-containing protein [Xylariaceae sp. FL0594]
MFSKFLSATAVALAATQAAAQTFTLCDPRQKSCPPDPAFGKENTVTIDFTKGESEYFSTAAGTTLKYGSKGAEFSMANEKQAPTVTSTKYIFFGKIDVEVQVAPGTGVVTSVVLQSDDRDEIDWEWLGGDTAQVQTNYFGKGDDSTFDRGGYSPVSNPQTTVHKYTIDWTKDYVHWIIDGQLVRELKYSDAKGGTRFPQTPCQLKLGIWDAGSSTAPEGTVQWAGGLTDFSKGPFTAYYKSVTIQDYANGVSGAKEYVWKSGSDGSYQSIDVKTDGSSSGGDDTTTSSSSSSTAKPTSTSSSADETTTKSATKTQATTLTTTITSAASTTTDGGKTATKTSTSFVTPTGSASPSGTPSGTPSGSATPSASPTNAAFQLGFNGALVGAGLIAALAL